MKEIVVNATWMRGGTSKCWVFEYEDLQHCEMSMDNILLRAFGSPDERQLDGIGGGTSTTSKAVILSPYKGDDFDVNYLFAQVGIEDATVDWGSNCGNCSSVVAVYAIEKGWVKAEKDITNVRVYNENTNQAIIQQVNTPNGKLPDGISEMVGSVYPGIEVNVGFRDPAGKTTGKLFPASDYTSKVVIDNKSYDVTMIDAGAPCVYLDATSLGLNGKSREEWTKIIDQNLPLLDNIRRHCAVSMGLADKPELAARAIPKLGVIHASMVEDANLSIQMLSMGKRHPAMPVTGSVALTLSARYPDTVTSKVLGYTTQHGITLDTPSGLLKTFATDIDSVPVIGISRTCRTIAQATINIPLDRKSVV